MFNYSDDGIYFESDVVFQKGTKIYVSIQNSSYLRFSGFLKYYKGKVRWRKVLKRSFFNYGYGIQLISDSNNRNLESNPAKNTRDLRKHPRKPYFRTIQFGNHKKFFGPIYNLKAKFSGKSSIPQALVLRSRIPESLIMRITNISIVGIGFITVLYLPVLVRFLSSTRFSHRNPSSWRYRDRCLSLM
jgi:hypothetical protein